jgi:hypothetical protein
VSIRLSPVCVYNKDTPFCWIFQVLILDGACQRQASGARVERSEAKRNGAERESPARPCSAAQFADDDLFWLGLQQIKNGKANFANPFYKGG